MIEHIEIRQLDLPLIKPYRLAFGPVLAFETLLVVINGSDGMGFGEATLLPGYTDETVEDSWRTANILAPQLTGLSVAAARDLLAQHVGETAFTATAFLTALDYMKGHPALMAPARVPLLAILSSDGKDFAAAEAEVEKHLAKGYGTLKFKVGFDLASDVDAVRTIQRAVAGRAKIRVDANQGFSVEEAIAFLEVLDPTDIELVEQPCDKTDWGAAAAVRPRAGVPLMLDEAIYGPADIDRAAEGGLADYIKYKLMKIGDIDSLRDVFGKIRGHGMIPVLGNGVATDIGNWMEAAAAAGHIDNAGEFNGFLKTEIQLLEPPLVMDGADIVLDGTLPGLNRTAVEASTVRAENFSAGPAARSA